MRVTENIDILQIQRCIAGAGFVRRLDSLWCFIDRGLLQVSDTTGR